MSGKENLNSISNTTYENAESRKLQGNMGTAELVMTVIAFSAPLATAAGFIPVLLTFCGSSAPSMYIMNIIILLLFAVGFTRMGTVMKRPGGFYAYITDGLGRNIGFTAAALAAVGYTCIGLLGPPFFAVFLGNFITTSLNGPSIPWWIIAILAALLSTALAYRKIDLSAKVLLIVMALECVIVAVFDIAAFIAGGPSDGGGAMFTLPDVMSGTFGLAFLFCMGNFFGFEATVIYREEVKRPEKTIPRATYIAILGIGGMYLITSWAFTAYFGADNVGEVAKAHVDTIFFDALSDLTGKIIVDFANIVTFGSIFACMLSIQNTATRYWYSLGRDHVLPKVLGRAHKKHHSPYVAASFVGTIWVIMLIIFALSGTPADYLYPLFSGTGTFMVTIVLFLASVSIPVYFRKNKDKYNYSKWITVVAPCLAMIGIGSNLFLAVLNFNELIGSSGWVTIAFFVGVLIIIVASYCYASYLQKNKPEIYERIGRQID